MRIRISGFRKSEQTKMGTGVRGRGMGMVITNKGKITRLECQLQKGGDRANSSWEKITCWGLSQP